MSQQDITLTVRALMRELWRIYDSGGHSTGRSLRSKLLEAAFWPQPEELPEVGRSDAELRALRRMPKETRYLGLLSTHLERMSDEMFYCLALKAMQKERSPGDPPRSYTEQQILACALTLLRAEERLAQYAFCGGSVLTAEQLVVAGMKRKELKGTPLRHWHFPTAEAQEALLK